MKWIVALAALLCAAPSPPLHPALQGDYPHDEAAIVLVRCYKPTGNVTGSAFKVSERGYITAHHVVDGGICTVGGQVVTVTAMDDKRDYAAFIGPASSHVLRPSCAGFKPGTVYAARGFPGGSGYNIFTPWLAIRAVWGGFNVFAAADSIPGMSGGPILAPDGRVTGIVNMRFPPRSMSLSNTGYCKA